MENNTQTIEQISVFLENKRGSLWEMLDCIGNCGINISALSIADTTDFGIVRLIVAPDDIGDLMAELRKSGIIAKRSEVIAVRVAHEPGSLCKVLGEILKRDIQVEYAYSMCKSSDSDAVILLQTSDNPSSINALLQAGIELVASEEICQL